MHGQPTEIPAKAGAEHLWQASSSHLSSRGRGGCDRNRAICAAIVPGRSGMPKSCAERQCSGASNLAGKQACGLVTCLICHGPSWF